MNTKKAQVVTFGSIKGGVGKSILSIMFSYMLSNMNKKVLIIDLNPQNSVTRYFMDKVFSLKNINVFCLLKQMVCDNAEKHFEVNDFLSQIDNYTYLLPSHPDLLDFEGESIKFKEVLLKFCFKEYLIKENFDYVIIDTAPNSNFLLKNALSVTDNFVVPIEVERWSIEGFSEIGKRVNRIEEINRKKIDISIIKNRFIKNRNEVIQLDNLLEEKYKNLIKGKVHYTTLLQKVINKGLVPNKNENYYKEIKNALSNILNIPNVI
ncbi:ParA family protein (plasmid) [Borrelia turcica IST7]|uniref:ParA family protein n=1 Tax=Borrelia turcica IST7 TaxID=1104446 RepID=A0A386PQJ7_9SPIR|nr:ParA family protein [Borrelia turcica]AYE36967.1 ParA family protein [Borrelia turcica IST7]